MLDPNMAGVAPKILVDVRKPHRSRWEYAGWIVAILVTLSLTRSVVTNPNFHWDIAAEYLMAPIILRGVGMTLVLTAISIVLGVLIGAVLAVMMRSQSPVVAKLGSGYVWFFRGTPLLVQLIFWFNLAALYPTLGFFGYEVNATQIVTPFLAAIIGLITNEAAYMAEIVRGGFESVNRGQTEAATSLGLRPRQVTFRILLPQAMKVIVPVIGNQTIAMLKNSSLVSVLGVSELLHSAEIIYGTNYQTIPLLIVASLWYLALSTVFSVVQHGVERAYGRSTSRKSDATWKELLRRGRDR
ncbi:MULTISPECIES: amino acid ABC transporter permease [unclassified Bradyrhizobium]|uniref:amino acid ABC transporter permease n=1 Tax=unclassified Bradyrhizobium TaxID=2631580 RepID=UPI0023023FBA|nr:amino acid ABC transporter permease [Bradyrhizobium sp. CCBAU 45321]